MGKVTTVKQVKKHNDLGLGAGVGLGEVIMVNGHAYIAGPHGKGKEMKPSDGLSYMTATEFKATKTITVKNIQSIAELQKVIKSLENNDQLMYAIKVTGDFNNVEARSENYQTPPYTPIVSWMKTNQNVFNFKNTKGTLVIFQSPKFMDGIGVPGFHTHFLSSNHKQVGHVFDVNIKNATIELQPLKDLKLSLRTNLSPVVQHGNKDMSGFSQLETNHS